MFTAQLRDGLSQGDVVDLCPVGSIPPIRVARVWDRQTPPEETATILTHGAATPFKRPPAPALFKRKDGAPESVLLEALLKRCVVLSEDCVVLEKVKNRLQSDGKVSRKINALPWHIAPLEPWPPDTDLISLPDGSKLSRGSLISAGRFKSLLAVPDLVGLDGKRVVEKGFVDLRFATPLRADFQVQRVASMTDEGRSILTAKMYTFWSGLHVPDALVCPSCGVKHSLDELLEGQEANATPAG